MEFILKQHKTDARNHMDYCAFAVRVHAKKNHFPNLNGAGIFNSCCSMERRKDAEEAHIVRTKLNTRIELMQ